MFIVRPPAPKIAAVSPNGFLVRSRTTGMILRAKMMSLAACKTRSLSFIVDIGWSASKRAVRSAISAAVIWLVFMDSPGEFGGAQGSRADRRHSVNKTRLGVARKPAAMPLAALRRGEVAAAPPLPDRALEHPAPRGVK